MAVLALSAADLTGRWSGPITANRQGPAGPMTETHNIVLKQEGTKLTGQVRFNTGSAWEITNGRVDGQKVLFEAASADGGLRIAYDLEIAGEELSGKVTATNRQGVGWTLRMSREK